MQTLAEFEAAQAKARAEFLRKQTFAANLPTTADDPTIVQQSGFVSVLYTRPTLRAALELAESFGGYVPTYEYAATFGHWEPIELRDRRKNQNEFENARRDPRPFAAELRLYSFAIYDRGGLTHFQSSADLSLFARVGEQLAEVTIHLGRSSYNPPHYLLMRRQDSRRQDSRFIAPDAISAACKRETRYSTGDGRPGSGVDARFYFSEFAELAALCETLEPLKGDAE